MSVTCSYSDLHVECGGDELLELWQLLLPQVDSYQQQHLSIGTVTTCPEQRRRERGRERERERERGRVVDGVRRAGKQDGGNVSPVKFRQMIEQPLQPSLSGILTLLSTTGGEEGEEKGGGRRGGRGGGGGGGGGGGEKGGEDAN